MDVHRSISDPFSCEVLEFPSIVALFRRFLSGPLSEPALAAIRPRSQLTQIQGELEAAREARDYLITNPRPALGGLADPRPQLEALRVEGTSCTALEILAVVEVARAASNGRELFARTPFATLDALTRSIPDLGDLVKELGGKILPDGSVDSSASPALARIRRSLERTRLELQSRLEKVLRRLGQDQLLQDDVITLRNGRFVLPVKTEKKRQVEGVVHGSSSSGQSVYVEPLETLPLNNELVELQDKEAAEVQRVLSEFSERLRARRQELLESARLLSELDLAFAKAEFARRYGACFPEFSTARELVLREARHPLLVRALRATGGDPVPLTIELGESQTLVVISGPNTGGKTVALKTVGTAVLMAQASLPVAAEMARIPLFERVLADIGDKQSIERNLSTFSAHIRNIQAMIEVADPNTLALLDEIGGSTDPHEGAALAVAILEHFRQRGSMVFVSTHHSRLKEYAAGTPQAVNASMDFDETTLQPTYKFLPGLPGKSSGVDIAQRLGLDIRIVEQARALLGPAETEVAALVASLHAKRRELEAAMETLRQQSRDLETREARLKQEIATERQAKLRELDKRLERTLREYTEEWKAAIEEIRKQAQSESKSTKALARTPRKGETLARDTRDKWNTQVLETLEQSAVAEEATPEVPITAGDQVQLPGFSTPGVVRTILGGDRLEVEVGRLRMTVSRNGVRVLSPPNAKSIEKRSPTAQPAGFGLSGPSAIRMPPDLGRSQISGSDADARNSALDVPAEINVIGRTAEEARDQVDKFLDSAFLAGRFKLRIIHGYGKGILRKTLAEMFASHPHVARFYPAPRQEGGEGATVVELKK